MRYFASTLMILASGLWLGGLIALFLFAPAVFRAFGDDRATAGTATSAMFVLFARYQLAVSAAALLGAFLGYLTGRSGTWVAIFALLAVAALGAVANGLWLVPRMETLRQAGESAGADFKRLHGHSMLLYVAVTAMVFIAVTIMPVAVRSPRPVKVPPETAA